MKIRKSQNGFRGDFYNLGEEQSGSPRNGNTVSAIQIQDSTIKFSLDQTEGDFKGSLAPDGRIITGTWTTLFGSQPLTLTKVMAKEVWPLDPSPHKVRFVTAQKGVALEVLDWGGKGPPLLFLSGLGNTAHVYDGLAPEFTATHHVYAMTRRGFGLSSAPPDIDTNYDADRLGDDVLAVIDALKLNKPVLAGHSIAGEELSSIGTRHPEKISGLIYLDAIYAYSFYDPSVADLSVGASTVKRDLARIFDLQNDPAGMRALIAEIQGALPNLQKALSDAADATASLPDTPQQAQKPQDLAGNRIFDNTRRYGVVNVPVLAIIAEPRACGRNCEKPFMQKIMAADAARSAFFEKQSPNAHLVRLAGANHFIWRSNRADVVREMNAFMDALPKN